MGRSDWPGGGLTWSRRGSLSRNTNVNGAQWDVVSGGKCKGKWVEEILVVVIFISRPA